MKKAIRDSKPEYYKWEAKKDGLHWGYLDTVFTIEIGKKVDTYVKFEDLNSGVDSIVFVANDNEKWLIDGYHDFVEDLETAVYWAARRMISKAYHLY